MKLETGGTNKRILVLAIILMFLSTFISPKVSANIPTYTIDENYENISINSSEKFNVSLRMNLGYEWNFHLSNSSVLRLVDEGGWVVHNNPGSPAYLNWTFEGRNKGSTTLAFIYSQSYGNNDTIIKTFTLNVTVITDIQSDSGLPILVAVVIIITICIAVFALKSKKSKKHHK